MRRERTMYFIITLFIIVSFFSLSWSAEELEGSSNRGRLSRLSKWEQDVNMHGIVRPIKNKDLKGLTSTSLDLRDKELSDLWIRDLVEVLRVDKVSLTSLNISYNPIQGKGVSLTEAVREGLFKN